MANADLLWEIISSTWPENKNNVSIAEIQDMAPLGTAGITNQSSYNFAMLTLLSTERRSFIAHEDMTARNVINSEVLKTNRNNGIWKQHLKSFVRKS